MSAFTELLDLARQYASECGECAGVGIQPDDSPCDDCKPIRDVIALAEAAQRGPISRLDFRFENGDIEAGIFAGDECVDLLKLQRKEALDLRDALTQAIKEQRA